MVRKNRLGKKLCSKKIRISVITVESSNYDVYIYKTEMPNCNLEELKAYLTNVRSELNIISPSDLFQEEVEQIIIKQNQVKDGQLVQKFEQSVQSLLQEQKEYYINAFQEFLSNEKTFPWNDNNISNDIQKDTERYIRLIKYCSQLKDTRILDELGIYPLVQRHFLAKPGHEYIRVFKNAQIDPEIPEIQKPYYEYLIRAFKYLFSQN
jgi:hypothetical protein